MTEHLNRVDSIVGDLYMVVELVAANPTTGDISSVFEDEELMDFLENYGLWAESLGEEIRQFFASRERPELQDRAANDVRNTVLGWVRTYELTAKGQRKAEGLQGYTLTEIEEMCLRQSKRLLLPLRDGLWFCIRAVALRLSEYAPHIYAAHQEVLSEFVEDILPNTPTTQQPAPTSTSQEPGVKWKGSVTDLAEVVWALAKSRRIENTAEGKPATIPETALLFEKMLGIDLNVTGLMQGRKDSYKAKDDGLTFTAALAQLVDEYIAR
jgi:hypothetical protein